MPGITLPALLSKHALERVDVLVTDTEGYDYEILRQVDWEAAAPDLVVYEHRHLSRGDARELTATLADHGYAFLVDDPDTAAVRDPAAREAYREHLR